MFTDRGDEAENLILLAMMRRADEIEMQRIEALGNVIARQVAVLFAS